MGEQIALVRSPFADTEAARDEIPDVVRPCTAADELPVVEPDPVADRVGVARVRIAVQQRLRTVLRKPGPRAEAALDLGKVEVDRLAETSQLPAGTQQPGPRH